MGIPVKVVLYFCLYFLAFGQSVFTQSSLSANNQVWTIHIDNIKGEKKEIYCEVAETEEEKRRGLMFRNKLGKDECMIFLYENPTLLTFWMKNTYIPLSIAFVNKNHQLTDMFDMKPMDETIISSTTPGIFAIEVNRGWFKKNLVYPGNKIRITREDLRKKKPETNP